MQLVANGEMGILVEAKAVDGLVTVPQINQEINRVTLGDYDPRKRDNDTVVDPREYISYLTTRKEQVAQAQLKPQQELNQINAKLDTKILGYQKDDLIGRLLKVAKRSQLEANAKEETYYTQPIPTSGKRTSITPKGPLQAVMEEVAGDLPASVVANIAMARGLLGDVRAEKLITDLYDKETYSQFLTALQGGKKKDDHKHTHKPTKSQSHTK